MMTNEDKIAVLRGEVRELYELHNDLANTVNVRFDTIGGQIGELRGMIDALGLKTTVPVKKSGWIDIYANGNVSGVHATELDADRGNIDGRVACVAIEWTE
jgi:hypothetical protein